MSLRIGCVLMAAGSASRFGSDKLAVRLGGQSLLRRASLAVPAARLWKTALVTSRAEGRELAREFGFVSVENNRPELGASLTVRLGLEAVMPCDAALFMAADQPMLSRFSVEQLLEAWEANPGSIAALASKGRRGNPVVFPEKYFGELLSLEGDIGGSAVIRRHPEALLTVEAGELELQDVDYVSDLELFSDK